MLKRINVYIQYLLPQQLITFLFGYLSRSANPTIKNWAIKQFIKRYNVDLSTAEIENALEYPSFESFFIRKLKPSARPFESSSNSVISPVDGVVAEAGQISAGKLLQAKGQYYDVATLLGDASLSIPFLEGSFATFYLAPRDYHRIHMPIDGKLLKTIFIPGRLFSVNRMTTDLIPQLYARNERLVCLFETEVGQMAVILVGAMIVGSMQVAWVDQAIKAKQLQITDYAQQANPIVLKKGEELGHFKIGSTVVLLFEQHKIEWINSVSTGISVQFGQKIANFINAMLN